GWTPLHKAAYYGKVDVFELLLKKGADIKIMDNRGATALYWASTIGNEKVVESLVEKSNVNSPEYIDLWSPLHRAAYRGHLGIVKLLLSNGAGFYAETHDY
ncbi:ankyrin repeat protein, partial [Leptodontidium sp. MPI-SDFR-AT-0119]